MPSALRTRSTVDLGSIAHGIAADTAQWLPLVRFDENERWYTRFAATPYYEVWLLSWLPGQRTGIHAHGGSAGAFVVAQGTLRENTVDRPWSTALDGSRVIVSQAAFDTGQVRDFDSHHVHEIVNEGPVPAVSIHVYAPALDAMSRYRLDGNVLRLTVSERVGADW